jgi:hypothetical protein
MRYGTRRKRTQTEPGTADTLLWVVAGTLLAAAAVTVGSCQRSSPITTLSEEPPIRVKNRSLDLIITGDKWKENGNKKNWKPTKYDRSKEDLDVLVSYDAGATCKGGSIQGREVDIEFKDKDGKVVNNVNVTAPGKKLKVVSDNDLNPNGNHTVISYGTPGEGWISRLLVNKVEFCSFDSAKALNEIVILDYPPSPED